MVYEGLQKIGDILFADNTFYIWLDENKNKSSILSTLKKAKVTNFFVSEIREDMIDSTNNSFVSIWMKEHFNELTVQQFEAERQEQIQEMLENIEKANQLLEERKQNKIKEVGANGRIDQEEQGKTEEGTNAFA
jgi:hypothetical protein